MLTIRQKHHSRKSRVEAVANRNLRQHTKAICVSASPVSGCAVEMIQKKYRMRDLQLHTSETQRERWRVFRERYYAFGVLRQFPLQMVVQCCVVLRSSWTDEQLDICAGGGFAPAGPFGFA